jgi:hypothetical protein
MSRMNHRPPRSGGPKPCSRQQLGPQACSLLPLRRGLWVAELKARCQAAQAQVAEQAREDFECWLRAQAQSQEARR